ncbi:MAG TPA: two-component regulator propeller domain-containing protein [Acidobacteriaceae bacterium]|nr:two-component regulator propeller domain-containing protein [Acidobacteriaceae bacterium]
MILAVILACQAHALDRNSPIRHFGRRVWQTDEGLPQNTVNSILQTRDGYLWIATEGGLARFDGIQFAIFNQRTTPQLHSNEVNSLYQDSHGVLWISTADGLTSYNGVRWSLLTTQDGLPSNDISSVYEDHRGVLWILTANGIASDFQGRIHSITAKDGLSSSNVISILDDADGNVWIATDSGLDRFNGDQIAQVYSSAVSALTKSPKGVVWIATQEGIASIQQGKPGPFFNNPALLDSNIETLLADQQGRLWIGTTSGLMVWDKHSLTSYTTRNGLPGNSIHQIYEDREGAVWVSTDNGIARFVDGKIDLLTTSNGLSAPLVLDMFEDHEGSLWLGTDAGGMTMLRNQKFTSYTATDGLAGDDAKAILEDHENAVWVGTNGNGLSRLFHQKFTTINAKDGLSSNVVFALADDLKGGLWIGTPDGLDHLHEGHVSLLTSADGLEDDYIRSLLVDADGSLWVGTRHGLSHWKNGTAINYTQKDGLTSDYIGALVEDKEGNLWIGTLNGLNVRKRGHIFRYTIQNGLSSNVITTLFVDSKNTLWIGTKGGGLDRFKNGLISTYKYLTVLPENIYGLIADESGNLWISSDRGIFSTSMADLNAFAEGHVKTVNVLAYGTADGMPTSQCSSGGHPAVSRSADGTLWFTTPRGITSIQPEHAIYNKVPPPVAIEQVSVDDVDVPPAEKLVVAPGHTRYAFHYAGLSFIAPQNVRFQYRLDGFDKTWIDSGTRRQAYYTNLKPGKYTFHVIAANNDNVWNMTGSSFYFQVQPHIYQTLWFYLILCLMLGLVGYELYRFRMKSVELQFNAVLAERNRIAREIHDTLAQGFVAISLQLEVAKRLVDHSNESAKNHIEQALSLVNSSLSEARHSIWDLRSQTSRDKDFPARLSGVVKQAKQQSVAEIDLDIHGAYRPMPEATENELLKIVQEALINAVRHAGASRIRVLLAYEQTHVRMIISDDGRGLVVSRNSDSDGDGHYGLTGMRERAKLIHATFHIESKENEGTAIILDIET